MCKCIHSSKQPKTVEKMENQISLAGAWVANNVSTEYINGWTCDFVTGAAELKDVARLVDTWNITWEFPDGSKVYIDHDSMWNRRIGYSS